MDISIAIPCFNSQDNLPITLKAIEQQVTDAKVEVIVVDCSDHDKVESVCARFSYVRYHREAERFSPGIGRNIGAGLAKGSLLVFIDDDVVIEQDSLQNAWQYYSSGNKAFGGVLELNTQANADMASYVEHFFFNSESQRGRPVSERDNLSSALLLIDRELFLSAGGFKNIPRMQDTELTERLIREGNHLTFNPGVVGLQTQDSPLAKVMRKILICGKNVYFIRYSDISLLKRLVLIVMLPMLAVLKISRIILRHLKYQPAKNKFITLLISPMLYVSGFYWMFGFYNSLIFGGEISKNRD